MEFCEIFRQKCAEDDTFPEKKNVWSDEVSLAESSFNILFFVGADGPWPSSSCLLFN
jgi:hypothetical protein